MAVNRKTREELSAKPKNHTQHPAPSKKHPASSNGFALSTEKLHQLLSGDQDATSLEPFEQAVLKQKQALTICNLLDRQNSIHQELDDLINSELGAINLDQMINDFKSRCSPELLLNITHSSGSIENKIPYSDNLQLHFFSLINELLFTPLQTLSHLQIEDLSAEERQDWYEWSLSFQNTLDSVKKQIDYGYKFFKPKTFDKLSLLANDTDNKKMSELKNLFSCNNSLNEKTHSAGLELLDCDID